MPEKDTESVFLRQTSYETHFDNHLTDRSPVYHSAAKTSSILLLTAKFVVSRCKFKKKTDNVLVILSLSRVEQHGTILDPGLILSFAYYSNHILFSITVFCRINATNFSMLSLFQGRSTCELSRLKSFCSRLSC